MPHERVEHAAPSGCLRSSVRLFLLRLKAWKKWLSPRAEEMRPDRAADVAAVRRVLDLDDLGAEVGEQHGAERAGAVLLDGEDAQAGEGKHVRSWDRTLAAAERCRNGLAC